MIKLAKREEQIMQVYWELGHAFIKEVIPHLPAPKPHYKKLFIVTNTGTSQIE
jgi:BlaI family penicillinase repressor